MSVLDSVNDNLKEFDKVLDENEKYGTRDSEVLYLKRSILRKALALKQVNLPKSARDWEIYSDMVGSDVVAEKLHIAMRRVLESVESLTIKDMKSPSFKTLFGMYLES
jgi:hypothetical protein